MIKMQTRLQDLLGASTTAEEAAQRFSDLRVVAALVCASWPMAQDLLTPDLVSAVAGHVHESDGRSLYSPPRSPMATAALLQAAEAVLDMDDLEQALTSFRRASWSGLPSLAPWSYILDRNRGSCSERLLLAAEPSIRAFRRDGGASGLRAPTRTVGYQPEHIAAALEHGHFERHLAAFDWGPHTRAARRLAAIKLVQWRTGGAISQAASYLGFAPGPRGYTINKGLRQQLAIHSDQFTAALRALARELDAAPAPVDYRRRRIALSNWRLNQDDWQEINDSLPRPRFERNPRRDHDARHGASAFIWAHVTQGEARYAPRPIERTGPESNRHAWPAQCSSTWFHIGAATTPHHTALRTLLIEFGEQLTKQIDNCDISARATED